MKRKEFEQLKTKPIADLEKIIFEQRDLLWNLKNDLQGGKVKNVKEIQKIKKTIAQLLTVISGQKQKHGHQ